MKDNKFKQQVLKYAEKHTMAETARMFGVATSTISNWKKTVASGPKAQKANKLSVETKKLVRALIKDKPQFTVKQIKESLQLPCTLQAIYKLYAIIKSEIKADSAFSNFQLGIKCLAVTKEKTDCKLYQYYLRDLESGLVFTATSEEINRRNITVFLDYVFSMIKHFGFTTAHATVYAPASSTYLISQEDFPNHHRISKHEINLKNCKADDMHNPVFPEFSETHCCSDNTLTQIYTFLLANINQIEQLNTERLSAFNKLTQSCLTVSIEELLRNRLIDDNAKKAIAWNRKKLNLMLEELEKKGDRIRSEYHNEEAYEIFDNMLNIINLNEQGLINKKVFTLIRKGMVAEKFLENRTSKTLSKQAYELAKTTEDNNLIANSEYFYGYKLHRNCQYKKALSLLKSSLAKFETLQDYRKINIVSGLLALLLIELEQINQGFRYAVKSFRYAYKCHNKELISRSYNSLGKMLMTKKYYSAAIKCYERSVELSKELKNISNQYTAFDNISLIYCRMGDYLKSKEYTFRATALAEQINDLSKIAEGYMALGIVYEKEDKFNLALHNYLKAYKLYSQQKKYLNIAYIFQNIGRMNLKQRKFTTALKYYNRGLELSKKHNMLKLINQFIERIILVKKERKKENYLRNNF